MGYWPDLRPEGGMLFNLADYWRVTGEAGYRRMIALAIDERAARAARLYFWLGREAEDVA